MQLAPMSAQNHNVWIVTDISQVYNFLIINLISFVLYFS